MSSIYDVAIRIASDSKELVRDLKRNTGLLETMGAVAATAFAADIIKDAVGEIYNYGTGIDTIRQKLEGLTDTHGGELDILTGKVKAVADVWGKDYNEVINTSNVMAKQMGVTTAEALNLIKQGLAKGGDATGDFLQQIKEYSPMFKDAQLSAGALVSVITQSVTSGVFSDKGADAIKESMLRIREMTKATADALSGIGISSDNVQKKLQDGTWSYIDVLKLVSKKLGEFPAQSKEVGTAIADIFGGPGEDAGLEYLKTLKDIETNIDNVKSTTGSLGEQQLEQAAASERLSTAMADLFGGVNKSIAEIKITATNMAAGVVENFDTITGVVKVGTTAFIAYKAVMIAANFSMMKWKRTIVMTRRAVMALNVATKSNPIALVVGLLATAGAAFLEYGTNVENTTKKLQKFSKSQEKANNMLGKINSLKQTFGIIKTLNKRQLEDFKMNARQQLKEWEDIQSRITATVLQEYNKSKAAILKSQEEKAEKLIKSGKYTEAVARKIASSGIAGRLKFLKHWASEQIKKQYGVTLVEISENKKRLKSYIDTVNSMTNTKPKQGSWYAEIESSIKKVKQEIDKVAVGDKERLTLLQAQLANLENQKKELKQLGEVPAEIPITVIKDDDEELDDTDLEIVDDEAVKILADYRRQLKETAQYNALLGDSNTALKQSIDLTKQTISSLIADGYDKNRESIHKLMADLDKLQDKYNSSNAGFMEWVGNLKSSVGAMQSGISNITALGGAIDAFHQKQENGGASLFDYIGLMLQMAQSILGTIEVVNAISAAVKAKQAVDAAATTAQISGEAAKAAAVTTSQATQAAAVSASSATQAAALTLLGNAGIKANAARGISSAVASAAALPFPMNLAAMSMAYGASSGLFAASLGFAQALSVPAFADGGVITGPTLGLVGEYPGARNNPELIAPANKMMKYIKQAVNESGGGVGGTVEFKIKGDQLVGVLNKSNRKSNSYR